MWMILAALVCLLSGCGLMMNSTTQVVSIDSVPVGAVLEVDRQPYQTPFQIKLSRRKSYAVTYRAGNGATATRMLCPEPTALPHVFDFLTVPIVFNLIDKFTAADYEFPESFVMPLPPTDAPPEFRSEVLTCPE